MRKAILVCILFSFCLVGNSQIEVAKLIGKDWKNYHPGLGAFLKFAYPLTEVSAISIEAGALFFFSKDDDGDGLALVPIKLGYRFMLNGTSTGPYAEPQAGYNFFGANSYDGEHPYKGPDLSMGFGYLFEPSRLLQFDLGLRFETVLIKGGAANFIALRLSHNFTFGRKE